MACKEFRYYKGCPNCTNTKLLVQFYQKLWYHKLWYHKVATFQTNGTTKAHKSKSLLRVPKDVKKMETTLMNEPKIECFRCEVNIATMHWYKFFSTKNEVPNIEDEDDQLRMTNEDDQLSSNGP